MLGVRGVRQGLLDTNIELPQQVDLCVSNHAFEHFADLDGVMQGVRRILRPGGYLFIVIPTYRHNKSSLSRRWMNSSHYSLFTHQSLSQLCARHGFSTIDYTYHGWWKEHDDLWFLARHTDAGEEPEAHYEDPREVEHYLSFVNPMRSLFMYPLYSHWPRRVRFFTGLRNIAGRLLGQPRRSGSEAR
jgi:SAM-dependent methyltransferase